MATGQSARSSLEGVGHGVPEPEAPFFARNFVKFLVAGILIEFVAVLVMLWWMSTGMRLIDLSFAGQTGTEAYLNTLILDKTLGDLAEPIEGLGVAFLIGGIAFGLMTIVGNLGMQANVLPEKMIHLYRR